MLGILSGFQKLNWEQMSAHTVKMILLVNVSLNEIYNDKKLFCSRLPVKGKEILDRLKAMPCYSNFRSRDSNLETFFWDVQVKRKKKKKFTIHL